MRNLFQTLILSFVSTIVMAQAATPPFWDEIQAFKQQDSLHTPPQNAILFVGSSSFQKWSDVQAFFPGYTIINRGFGGSSFPDLMRYADDVIFKYHPKQVVIYCGDNDLASSDTVTAQIVFQRFISLFTLIRSRLPQTAVAFVSIKPSPARLHLMPKMKTANALIKNFLKTKAHTAYVDVFRSMLQPDGAPLPAIFVADSLHMNAGGYKIWQKQIKPVLLK